MEQANLGMKQYQVAVREEAPQESVGAYRVYRAGVGPSSRR